MVRAPVSVAIVTHGERGGEEFGGSSQIVLGPQDPASIRGGN